MNEFEQISFGAAVLFFKNGTTATQVPFKTKQPVTRIETIANGEIDAEKLGYVSEEEDIERYRLEKGDILFSHINSIKHIGKTALVSKSENMFNGMNLLQIRPNAQVIFPAFLHELLKSEHIRANVRQIAKQAVNQASISIGQLQEISLQIPPLPEQKKIAEILSGIDKAIGARTNSAELTGKVSRFIADELFQQARIDHDSIPIGKCTRRLWQGINTAADKVVYQESGIPILQAKHITGGHVQEEGARHLSEDDYLRYSERYQPSAGDILFTNIGTIGKSALVPERSKFLIAWNIFLISPNERVVSEYLHYYLQVLDHRNYFHEHAAGNATKFINKTLISELDIPMPPLEHQKKICDQIRALKDAEQRNRSAAAKHRELKKSLSTDLLSGRKRVSV